MPIGTKLQLRARINPDSAWRHIKLLEVAVSPDPDRPHAPGAVLLVKDGYKSMQYALHKSLTSKIKQINDLSTELIALHESSVINSHKIRKTRLIFVYTYHTRYR